MNSAIVTGASGFIGKKLVNILLGNDIKVYAVVRHKENVQEFADDPNFTVIEACMEDYHELDKRVQEKNIDVFYHLAWNGVYGKAFRDYELQLSNAKFACDAFMGALKLKCKKFVIVGTVNQFEVKKCMNLHNCMPRFTCIYGTAKITAEMICKTLAYNYGMEFNSALLAIVYGEGDKSGMLPKILIEKLLKGEAPKLVEGDFLYDWLYVNDAVEALLRIGEDGKNMKSYYVGSMKLRTFKEIVTQVRDILNPSIILKFGEYPDSNYIDYSEIDINSLYEDTGFFVKSDFDETVCATAQWIKREKEEGEKSDTLGGGG